MKILVTFALESEFAAWRRLGRFERTSVRQREKIYEAQIAGARVRVVLTGAGPEAAERASAWMFGEPPDICIASGLAGALHAKYGVPDVLVARAVGEVSGGQSLESDSDLVESAAVSGARVVSRFVTSERVASTLEQKRKLAALGDAVEMESAHILRAALRRGIRSVAIRAISDGADADLPLDFDRVFTKRGEVSVTRVIGQLAARPQRLPALLRLARESNRAAEALARFLNRYSSSLAQTAVCETAKAGGRSL